LLEAAQLIESPIVRESVGGVEEQLQEIPPAEQPELAQAQKKSIH
jgi:hypothetical protein